MVAFVVCDAILRRMNTETNKQYEGVLMVRGRGVGFIKAPALEQDEDILIQPEHLGQALDGDTVSFSLLPRKRWSGDRTEGMVVAINKRAYRELIGAMEQDETGIKRFKPDNRRIHIRPRIKDADTVDATEKLVVEITEWPEDGEPLVVVTDTLGTLGTHETEMQAIIRGGGFAADFPSEVHEAAKKLYDDRETIFREALADEKRRDMRDVETFTIDPADAKDFDDALSYREVADNRYEIGIHIADVSHYVREGDPLDLEARERGTSIYLVDRVIPMLPEILSNDLCSLRPDEDRLAFSAVFTLDAKGEVHETWFGQTLIHSDTRFSYEDAQKILDEGTGQHHTALEKMMAIARKLREQRYHAGAIAFEQPEVKFELDERGAPIRAYTKERTETMLMIEDYMLLANQRVAHFIHEQAQAREQDTAFIFRVHDSPDPEKIEELALFVRALGYEFETKGGEVEARTLNQLMSEVTGSPEENLIKTATIRSMAKAIYSTKNIGHFGLAFTYYTHFTSPIRRYPDLLAHRMLRRHLDKSTISRKELSKYEQISAEASKREMEAVSAERDSIKFKQVEYMANKVGDVFDAVITGVTDWGVYVQEVDSQAEGMIHISKLGNDYFTHEKSSYHVKGERTGTKYRLGDEVKVKLTRADVDERQLDFELVT